MRMFFIIVCLLSFQAQAEQAGYNCFPRDSVEAEKLSRISSRLGPDYFEHIQVLILRPENCAEVVTKYYNTSCIVGKFPVFIKDETKAVLRISNGKTIDLICERDIEISGQPSGGGSN
jgi:hypothetical protein